MTTQTSSLGFYLYLGLRIRGLCLRILCILALAGPLAAQTVTPLIDENVVGGPGKSAKGRIEYINDSLETLSVVLEAKSFTVSGTGELSYRPLDSGIHLEFSSTSFKIPPKQSYYVFYEASADALPSWCVVYASFAGFHKKTVEGFKIQIQLPHTIYLLPKQKLMKPELQIKQAEYDPETKKVIARLENTGAVFGRVEEVDVSSSHNRAASNGFPIFPHSQRQVEIAWPSEEPPKKLVLRFDRFSLEQEVRRAVP